MKKNLIKCMMLMAIFATSCNNKRNTNLTVIEGKIANARAYRDVKEFTLTIADFGGKPTTYKGPIQKDGTFKIRFKQYIAQDVELTPFVRTVIAHPGDSIHVEINGSDVTFSGDAEETNTDLYHYTGEYYAQVQNDEAKRYFRLMDTANFRVVSQLVKNDLLKKRDEFITRYQPNEEVKSWALNYINIDYYKMYLNFNYAYNQINRIKKTPGFAPVALSGYTINDGDINKIFNNNLLNASAYELISQLAFINPELPPAKLFLKNELAAQLHAGFRFYTALTQNNAEVFDEHRKDFDTQIQAPFIKQPLLKYYADVKNNLANPQIASEAILKNATGTSAISLLDSIKAQHRGKVIYVDFWATWCGPCKAELPFSEKLIEKYKGKDVAFVFVCIDSPKDTWKLNLAQMKLTGNQYYCDKLQSQGVRKGFKIEGIPYYMMINKKGDITESGNGLRPHDPLTESKINKLLN